MRQQFADILKYWADVEALTAPQAEEISDSNDKQKIAHVRLAEYPWLAGTQTKVKHAVRFGVFSRSEYERELFSLLNTDKATDNDTGPRRKEKPYTYLGVFQVDSAGVPILDTLELAAYPVFFANMRGKQTSFVDYSSKIGRSFEQATAKLREVDVEKGEKPRPMDDGFVAALLAEMQELLEWTPPAMDRAPRLIVVSKKCKPNEVWQLPPVNGFFHEDLMHVLGAVRSGRDIGLVGDYLTSAPQEQRLDLDHLENIRPILSANRFPEGRWPSEFPLTLMQQVAVNASRPHLSEGGIFSVNGPPGTGKTTLLMDMVAANIVKRAEILCGWQNPEKAFERKWDVRFPNTVSPVFAIDERLHDFVMVVASSNNGAVENVTKELPDQEKIGKSYRATARYLEGSAAALLNSVGSDDAQETDEGEEGGSPRKEPDAAVKAWGLVSAVLGNKKNRTKVVETLNARVEVPDPKNPARKIRVEAPYNIFEQIKQGAADLSWAEVRKEFLVKVAAIRAAQQDIAGIDKLTEAIRALRREQEKAVATIASLETTILERSLSAENSEAIARRTQEAFDIADKSATLLHAARPGALAMVWNKLSSGNSTDWEIEYAAALFERKKALEALTTARNTRDTAVADRDAAFRAVKAAKLIADGCASRLQEAQRRLAETRARMPDLVGFDKVEAAEEGNRQQMLPNTTAALTRQRAELFIEAMRVHVAFAAAAGWIFKANLMRAFDMLSGDPAIWDAISRGAAPHLWATLCLAIPVVSTTFASFARCFANMEAGSIAWLFVDEAGQAVPQHAVGALWRAKRAMIVGDPFQVEPVITLDRNIDLKLLERHGVSKWYQSTATSAQVLADLANPFGAKRRTHRGDDAWVGCPLKVHRRCVDPMFSISNDIAYNGSMVLGHGKESQERELTESLPLLGQSAWFDVVGTDGNQKHFIPAQAEQAYQIVRAYSANGWVDKKGLPALFIISPFRTAADGMERFLRSRRGEWAPGIAKKDVDAWLDASVGTVHTFQGKESETVIFLLGGETLGAIKWAAGSPNIINVAVTRAKRRLYVVGDRQRWMKFDLAKPLGRLPAGSANWQAQDQDDDDLVWDYRHIALETRGSGDADEAQERRNMEEVLCRLLGKPWLRFVERVYCNDKVGDQFLIDVRSSDREVVREIAYGFSDGFLRTIGGHNGVYVNGAGGIEYGIDSAGGLDDDLDPC